jgi:hypothetical protein
MLGGFFAVKYCGEYFSSVCCDEVDIIFSFIVGIFLCIREVLSGKNII